MRFYFFASLLHEISFLGICENRIFSPFSKLLIIKAIYQRANDQKSLIFANVQIEFEYWETCENFNATSK